jgi:hypothetical protein
LGYEGGFLLGCSVSIALMMEAVQTSETLVNLHQPTQHYNPEDSNLHIHHCENLESKHWVSLFSFIT